MDLLTDLETRYPHGNKEVLFHKAKLEKSAEYNNLDGLTEKITIYLDLAREKGTHKVLQHICIIHV